MKEYLKEQWHTFLWLQLTLLVATIVATIFMFIISLVSSINFTLIYLGKAILMMEGITLACIMLKFFIDFIKLLIKISK